MKTWQNCWGYSQVVLMLSILLLEMVTVGLVSAQGGGGMMPLSDVIDHPVEHDNNKGQSSSSQNTPKDSASAEPYNQGKPLSEKKKKMHIKIAQSHLKDQDQADGEDTSGNVHRRDKSPDLQSPSKHASDEWLLTFLLEQYRISDTVDEKVEILQNLENFSHKFENGRDLFRSTKAVKEILIPALNSSQIEIRKSACAVFAVAAQNNAVVQKIAKDAGAIRSLVHLLSFDPPLRTKALFALSSLLRNYPEAQAKFIHEGGIPALIKVAFSFETRKRCLSLVTDLLTERKYCLLDLDNRRTSPEQYSRSDGDEDDFVTTTAFEDHIDHFESAEDPCDEFKLLEKALKDSGWCDVLSDSVKALGGFDTEDQLLTAEAVASSLSFCREEIAPFSKMFQGLLVKFEDDEDYQEESLTLRSIIDAISIPAISEHREEL